MTQDHEKAAKERRRAEALRANLRRRKVAAAERAARKLDEADAPEAADPPPRAPRG